MSPTAIEILNPRFPRGPFRAAIIDFDGTISLLRRDWQGVMGRMMVHVLEATGTRETAEQLQAVADDIIFRLTGQPTLVQMQALAAAVAERGARPRDAVDYFLQFEESLLGEVQERIQAIRARTMPASTFMVAGAGELIQRLDRAGLLLYVLSGTDLAHVRSELDLLGIAESFHGRVFAPINNDPLFTKLAVMHQILAEQQLRGEELIAIGDGPTEILAVKSLGGLGIGVASNEVTLQGIDVRKRQFLRRAGADIIIPDYRCLDELLPLICLTSDL